MKKNVRNSRASEKIVADYGGDVAAFDFLVILVSKYAIYFFSNTMKTRVYAYYPGNAI